jgi:hypothetical protein
MYVADLPIPPPAASTAKTPSLFSTVMPASGVISIVRAPIRKGQRSRWPEF